jgi:Tol biopolymer transport system component
VTGALLVDGRIDAKGAKGGDAVEKSGGAAGPQGGRGDLSSGTTELVTVSASGTETANGASIPTSISDDGRFITFTTFADNLVVTPDTNNVRAVFVRDMQTQQTTLVSVGLDGKAAGCDVSFPAMSTNGPYVVFISSSTNLVRGLVDTNKFNDAFVRDLQTGTTSLVSVDNSGRPLGAVAVAISADGQRIAFVSDYIYLRDMPSATTFTLDKGQQPVKISGDGTVVVFSSRLSSFSRIPDTNGGEDIFAWQIPR